MNIYDIVAAGQVMPVIVIDKASDAVALGNALLEGGIKTAEVTLRTPQALAAIEAMATSCPELMVGAGTVLNAERARQVRDAGGCFAVSPGATDALIQGCADADFTSAAWCKLCFRSDAPWRKRVFYAEIFSRYRGWWIALY